MWQAWIVTTQQPDTPLGLIEYGTRQRNPRAWLTIGVEAPSYDVEHGPSLVRTHADAVAWAETCGYSLAPTNEVG